MSIKLMYEIWDNQDPQLTGSRLVIMLCLADDADDNDECWLSIARIAALARITPANVTRHIKELEAAGYLIVTRTSGTHNIYVVSSTAQPQCPPAPMSSDPGGVGGVGLGECGRGANPHTNPILSPSRSAAGSHPPATVWRVSLRPRRRHPIPRASAIVTPRVNAIVTPRASAISPRAPAQCHPARQRNPPRAPARGLPAHQRALNHPLTIKNYHKNHQGNRQRMSREHLMCLGRAR